MTEIYQKCIKYYFDLKFTDVAAISKFTSRALKLAWFMLDHFTEIP